MIINFILNVIIIFLGALFSWLPAVEKIPSIVGYDIDTALVNGVGQAKFVFEKIWALGVMFAGFLVIMGYFSVKQVMKIFLGSRAP